MQDVTAEEIFSRQIRRIFGKAVRLTWRRPAWAWHFARTWWRQAAAARRRRRWQRQGVLVPAVLIASIGEQCNLACAGCYAREFHRPSRPALGAEAYRRIWRQAADLGIAVVILAGGEPLLRPDLLDLTARFPGTTFVLFTNGLALQGEKLTRLRNQRHVIPVLSLEGGAPETDARRGEGVYGRLRQVMARLQALGLFWGVSLTATRGNFSAITRRDFLDDLTAAGCRLFFYVEYVPIRADTEDWVLTSAQRRALYACVDRGNAERAAQFVALPGDETAFGGCLSAGRGFLHLAADGGLEPCPFAPFSDVNLGDTPLAAALRSDFLGRLREQHARLSEKRGGCALWTERNWAAGLLGPKRP